MKPLKNNPNHYIVPVPVEASEIQDTKANGIMWKMPDGSYDSFYFDDVIPQSSQIEIIGIFTPEVIGFDVEPFVERTICEFTNRETYKGYSCGIVDTDEIEESFHSLIQASGYYYVNPYGDREQYLTRASEPGDYSYLSRQWSEAQNSVIQKGVIIKLK